jgi:hypothetical protein
MPSELSKKRKAGTVTLRDVSGEDWCDELFIPTSGSTGAIGHSSSLSRQSILSLSSTFSSGRSSCISLSESEDEETRAIRRLLMRKIEAMIGGVFEETDKIIIWLGILEEVVKGVKRTAYLSESLLS